MLYKQSPARRYLMGHEQTRNPTPAAAAILQSAFGKRRVKGVIRAIKRRRRSLWRGNPLPAVVGLAAGLSKLGVLKRFKAPSEKRAQSVAGSIIAAANGGNLVAARGLLERAAKPMKVAESKVWQAAAAQLSARIRAAVQKFGELIPAADQSSPENFATSVLSAPPVDLAELEAQAAETVRSTKAERAAAAREAGAAGERREARLTELGLGIGQALAGRGRRPSTRRKRRRPRGRTVRL